MQIIGLGSDIVECVRIRAMIERHGEAFLARTFTERELRYCQSRRQATEHFASLWAAKEAVLKCIGVTGLSRTDIEVRSELGAAPQVLLYAGARERADEMQIGEFLLTIAHCRTFASATAIAVAERVPPG